MEIKVEELGGGIKVATSKSHSFGTDAFLLSSFARVKSGDMACDLGSGCGIIPLLWFRDINAPAQAVAVDIQPLAVKQMLQSQELSGLDARFMPLEADFADMSQLKSKLTLGSFDLVTCNPPYKAGGAGVISESSADKIARHETMCTIDDCCKAASALLRFGGRFCLCQLTERLVDVLDAMRRNKLEPKRIRFVSKTADAAPWLFLVEGKRGSKPFLNIEPPLFMYEHGEHDLELSGEIKNLYKLYSAKL